MTLRRRIFTSMYRRAASPEALAWHREEPPPLLARAVAERAERGRALDIGCGQGTNAVWLAQQGFDVVGVDFVPSALELARERARRAGVTLELRDGDVLGFRTEAPFDVVLDSGCLHHIPPGKVAAYRARLEEWLRPGGDYVLVHFARRQKADWLRFGPRRVKHEDMVRTFPSLALKAYDKTSFDLGFPMGTLVAGVYWFRRDVTRVQQTPNR